MDIGRNFRTVSVEDPLHCCSVCSALTTFHGCTGMLRLGYRCLIHAKLTNQQASTTSSLHPISLQQAVAASTYVILGAKNQYTYRQVMGPHDSPGNYINQHVQIRQKEPHQGLSACIQCESTEIVLETTWAAAENTTRNFTV